MTHGLLITFEGTEGSGKSTQIKLLAERLERLHLPLRLLREPGGTPIGEEIRHTLKHSPANHGMKAETELLLMNASRAQLVREVIQPALRNREIVICDRFYDSTIVYQGYGRGLDPTFVQNLIHFAVGETQPDLTLLLRVPLAVSEARRASRSGTPQRDRLEEEDSEFFRRVEAGYDSLAEGEPQRIRAIDATASVAEVSEAIWKWVGPFLSERDALGEKTYKSVGEWKLPPS